MMAVDDQLMTINQVARRASVTREAVYKWMKSGALRWVQVGARRRIPESAWQAFVKPGNTLTEEVQDAVSEG